MSKARKRETPTVIKVTVTKGQARVNLPKKTALKIKLITEEGEPGIVTHLLVTSYQNSVRLQPVEITEIETEE